MKNLFHFLPFMLSLLIITPSSYGQRYLTKVFDKIEKKTVVYRTKVKEQLAMDIFSPIDDKNAERPVILYVHGGGFSGGKRDLPDHIQFCEDMAKRGYVAITMSYSLVMKGKSFGCDLPAKTKIETFKSAAMDIAYATNYLIQHKASLKINARQIVLAGSSAGAEAVLHAAYMKESWQDGNKSVLKNDFKFGAVISMAGAIFDISLINEKSAIPSQLFHGTCDNLVPYGKASHHYCNEDQPGYLELYGAYAIAQRLKEINAGYYLVTGCNDGHEWNITPILDHKDLIVDFIYNDMMKGVLRFEHVLKQNPKACKIEKALPHPSCN